MGKRIFEHLLRTRFMHGLVSKIVYVSLLKAFKQNFKLLDLVINKKMWKVYKESESLVRKKGSVLVLLFAVVAVDVFVSFK